VHDKLGSYPLRFESGALEQTRSLGARMAEVVGGGTVLALVGDLGCGKTEFVRGFVRHLAPDAAVRSPSFNLVNSYACARMPLYHFDFYRLGDASELIEIGFEDYLRANGVCLIEWADMFIQELPPLQTIRIDFTDCGPTQRLIEITPPPAS
jgi:tRNA threonylcarbamoyladenosine biosynthesis protein TsaE